MLLYYRFLHVYTITDGLLKYSHEVRILNRILKRSGSEKQSHCFFTNDILLFFFSKPDEIVSFNFFIRKFLVLY